MSTYVYKYVLNDEIIYIGKADHNLAQRIAQHGKTGDNIPERGWNDLKKSKIYYIELANRVMSDVFESEMIRRYNPKYNKAKKNTAWCGLQFVEPEWKVYVKKKPAKKAVKQAKISVKEVVESANEKDFAKKCIRFVSENRKFRSRLEKAEENLSHNKKAIKYYNFVQEQIKNKNFVKGLSDGDNKRIALPYDIVADELRNAFHMKISNEKTKWGFCNHRIGLEGRYRDDGSVFYTARINPETFEEEHKDYLDVYRESEKYFTDLKTIWQTAINASYQP